MVDAPDNAGLLPCGCGGQAIRNVVEPHQHEIATYMPDYQGGTFIECSKCSMCASSEVDWNFAFTQSRTTASPSVDAMRLALEALQFYASGNHDSWCRSVEKDRGRRAKSAIAALESALGKAAE